MKPLHEERVEELLKYYSEHSDQEFVKKILAALREGELTELELNEIGNWIADRAKAKERKH